MPSGCFGGEGAYRIGFASDDLRVRLCRFIGIATMLLPIAQVPSGMRKVGRAHGA
jgi:hypothetical protein